MSIPTPTAEPGIGLAARLLATFTLGVAGFQIGLVAGLPWGAAAWGGARSGVLPTNLRVASAVSSLVFLTVTAIILGRGFGATGRRRFLLGYAIYLSVGIALNAASRSSIERSIWVPLTAIGATLAWLAWRETSTARSAETADALQLVGQGVERVRQ